MATPPTTPHQHTPALRRPTPAHRVAYSVSEVCEELWSVQDAAQAQPWLQRLHSALLRASVESYDPSEAFLCVQGAALNFPATWEHALWAAAALVRVCVGPAWRAQRLEPRGIISSTTTTLSESTEGESSPRQHHSPRSFSPISVDPQLINQHYPHIPEVLPGALLRFAAQAPLESRLIAEAQRELVLALCCLDDGGGGFVQRSHIEWNIPGAHEPVEKMMRFWLESTTSSMLVKQNIAVDEDKEKNIAPDEDKEIKPLQLSEMTFPIKFSTNESLADLRQRLENRTLDWWCALHVARACSDLVSVGWSPYHHHQDIILHLLDIVQQGIALRHTSPSATDQESREYRLAATSSAAEAISALAALGSRGLVPRSCQKQTVEQLLQLQVTSEQSSSYAHSLYPLGVPESVEQEHEWEQERETFFSQRASCFSDTADLLWVLLAHESSTIVVMAALLQDIELDLHRAAVVVRVVSGALWGKPPNVPGISTLRIYWKQFILVLTKWGTSFIQATNNLQEQSKASMTLVLEVIVALGRLVETELNRGSGILSSHEWNAFLGILKNVILPCLRLEEDVLASLYAPEGELNQRRPQKLLKRIKQESETTLIKLGEFLDRCARFDTHQCHLIVDDKCRDDLHFLLLRDIVPLLSKGPFLAIKVLRSWASIGFFPDRRESWVETAKALVADAFAVFENPALSQHGGFVHGPVVRLEALMLLSDDGSYVSGGSENQTNETSATSNTTGATAQSSYSLTSPLSSTMGIQEDYREFVVESILPCLSLVFQRSDICDRNLGKVVQYSLSSPPKYLTICDDLWQQLSQGCLLESHDYVNDNFDLRKYAIDLVGKLFCNTYTASETRCHFVSILRDIAIMNPLLSGHDQLSVSDGSSVIEPGRFSAIVTNRSLLALEAIGQLETCLSAPFFSVPLAHDSIPPIIDALCSILSHSATFTPNETQTQTQSKQQEYSFRLLSFAALVPLARLRRSFDGGLMLVDREETMDHFPEGIVTLFDERHCEIIDDEGPFVAPFTFVDTKRQSRDGSSSTFISFRPIVTTLTQILGTSYWRNVTATTVEIKQSRERARELENRFRASCHDALLNFTMSGVALESDVLFRALMTFPRVEGLYSGTENFARLRASLASFQRLPRNAPDNSHGLLTDDPFGAPTLVEQVLQLCKSQNSEEVVYGCKLLIGVFPSISTSEHEMQAILYLQLHQNILSTLMSRIRESLDELYPASENCLQTKEEGTDSYKTDSCPALLLLFYETSLYYLESFGRLESHEARTVVRLCYDVARDIRAPRSCRTLAVRCAVAVIDRLKDEDIEVLMEEYSRYFEEDLSWGEVNTDSSESTFPDSDIILCAMSYRSIKSEGNYVEKESEVNKHFALAAEVDNLLSFDSSKDCAAAWLCGDHLLTLKVGGSNSRNCGWMEITFRGATFRRRELVRLSSTVSIDRPEIPSPLWSTAVAKPGEVHDLKSKRLHNTLNIGGDDNVTQKAMEMLKRCDELLENFSTTIDETDVENGTDNFHDFSTVHELISHPSSPRFMHSDDSHSTSVSVYTQDEVPQCSVLSQIDTSDPTSVRSWLNDALDNSKQVEDVIKCLSKFGLDSIIECCSNAESQIRRGSYGRIYLQPVLRLKVDTKATKGLKLLDRTVTLDTHKVALMFASPPDSRKKEDDNEMDFLLKTPAASPSFFSFARGLGGLVLTRHLKYFSGGFDTSGLNTDGQYALVWIENNDSPAASTFVSIYHAVPFMPQNFNNRKRHVGNDSVHIVFCEPGSLLHEQLWAGGADEDMDNILVSGEFGFVTLFVIPLSEDIYRVKIQLKPDLPDSTRLQLHHLPGEDIVQRAEAPGFVRRLANLADIACSSVMHDTLGPPTSWEIRLRQLRLMRRHVK